MKFSQRTLAGTLAIAFVVAAAAWYARDPECQSGLLTCFSAGSQHEAALPSIAVTHVDWLADGERLLARFRIANNAEPQFALCGVAQPTRSMPIDALGDSLCAAAPAPDERHVLVASHQGRLWWLNPESFELATPLVELTDQSTFTATAVASDGSLVAAGTSRGLAYVCDPERRTFRVFTAGIQNSISDVRFEREGGRLLGAQRCGPICVWDVATGELLQELTGHPAPTQAEFLTDGKRLISAGLDGTVRIWEIDSGRELWRGSFGFGLVSVAVSADGKIAAWAGYSPRIVVWNLERQEQKFEITTSAKYLAHLQFSPDGTTLAAAGFQESIALYDTQTGAATRRIAVVSPERP